MASRTSAMRSQEYYLGSKRGRPIMEDIGWEMFPEKFEKTDIIEDPPYDQLNDDRRSTLKDYSPESNSLFPYEEARRNTYARDRLNLREGGARVTTDPWVNAGQNGEDGFDISFHDKDPRGWSTEQPWKEYRRLAEVQFKNTDFKDDGSYQETSGGIHPNTLYKKIRSAQNWVKSRLKIFSEERDGRTTGGVGIYPNVSKVYRSDMEDTSAQEDGVAPSRTYDDPEIAQHHNVNISNIVHLGSKALRVNSTTDHLVKVAAYGKLYKNRGMINHESQLRILEDDTPWSKMEGTKQSPKNIVKLMASQIYSDSPNISPYTASQIGRILMQDDQTEIAANQGISRDELQNKNRSQVLSKDIMALLGVTANDVKFLESQRGSNKKMAKRMLADIYKMATIVHSASANEKLDMRNELILRSAGMGLAPGNNRNVQDLVVVNPKIVEFMAYNTGKNSKPEDYSENRKLAFGDSENRLDNFMENTPLFVYKTPSNNETNHLMWESEGTAITQDTSKKTANYKHLAMFSQSAQKNRDASNSTQVLQESDNTPEYSQKNIGENDFQENMRNTALDNMFGENKFLKRHGGRIGTKQMRRHMVSENYNMDQISEVGSHDIEGMTARKNAKNRNNQTK